MTWLAQSPEQRIDLIERTVAFQVALAAWFNTARADLPWRQNRDPYHVWLSEIMLQQTQVNAVIPYYLRFLRAFPNVHTLANAPLDDVLKLWEGLGYYSRARSLHKAAQIISRDHAGVFPTTAEGLQRLPGVGRYTAAAIASICYGGAVAVLDGNVIRVLSRVLDYPDEVTRPESVTALWAAAEALLNRADPGNHNQAMMELGRIVCKPRRPDCAACPVSAYCAAFASGTQLERPVKGRKAPTPHYTVGAGVIYGAHDHGDPAIRGKLLIAQRKADGLLGGLWEFPGGKLESGETLEGCIARELHEELAIHVTVGQKIIAVNHAFTHFRITLHAYQCQYIGAENGIAPQTLGCAAYRWVTLHELDQFAFGKADRMVIAALRKAAGMS